MDERKGVNEHALSSNEPKPIRDRNSQFCNRIGCNGRLKSVNNTLTISPTKPKNQKPSDCCSSNTKPVHGSPSFSSCSVVRPSAQNSPVGKIVNTKKFLEPQLSRPKSSRFLFSEAGSSSTAVTTKTPNSKSRLGMLESPVSSKTAVPEKKKSCEGESSSSSSSIRGKKMLGPAPVAEHKRIVGLGISIPGSSTRNHGNGSGRGRSEGDNSEAKPTIMPTRNPNTSHSSRNIVRRQPHYNVHEIAELLVALERAEQRGEITYEQLRRMEATLFRHGLESHDVHSDLRLDIDDMSYEELLDLEEKMGTVSTALPEDELSKCIGRSIYRGHVASGDAKCSICQEEYRVGDLIGMLSGCVHTYHEPCVRQWLQLKNWCPVCKAPAGPFPPPSF